MPAQRKAPEYRACEYKNCGKVYQVAAPNQKFCNSGCYEAARYERMSNGEPHSCSSCSVLHEVHDGEIRNA